MNEKPTLNIVLVEPRIPQNTGNVARTCACTACRLHLVGPMGFAIDDKKLKHAGLDYWHYLDISYYDSLDEFFAKNSGPYYYFTTKAPQRYTDVSYPDGAYLVFGREDAGLPEALLAANQEHCIRMPMRDTCRSLNLSNSVAVGVYEVTQKKDTIVLNLEHLDVPMIRGLLVAFNGRVTAGAGSKPYLSVTLHPDEKPLELLQSILKAMAEILKPAE